MTDYSKICEYCGSPLASGANFCEACGQQVRKPQGVQSDPEPPPPPQTIISPQALCPTPPRPVYTPPPAYRPAPVYAPPAAPPKRSSAAPIILGVGGCLVIFCIVIIAVVAFFFLRGRSKIGEVSKIIPVESPQMLLPTELPLPTQGPLPTQSPVPTVIPLPTQADLPAVSWPADIGQQLTETYFSDDFSNAQYDWFDVRDDINSWGIEEEHYALHLFEADYTAWAYLPIEFAPTSIGFDAAVQPGYDQGAYGVICYYQDEANYHFVSIDPFNKEYSIGYVLDDEYETLMENMWMPSQTLNDSPYAVNNVLVVCDPDMITLFINNELEAQASITSVARGGTAILGETWTDTPSSGFRVLFDNLYAYVPVQ